MDIAATNKNNQKLKEGDLVAISEDLRVKSGSPLRIPRVGVITKVYHEETFGDFYYRVQWQMPYSLVTTEPENNLEKRA